MKIDISELHQRHLNWDDPIPKELKNIWDANFELIKEMGNLKFCRAIVPEGAVSLDIETIDTADAGEKRVCEAVYARFKLLNETNSCQLIFSRTKIVHDLTIPRAELEAAVLNASTGHVVRLSLKHMHKKLTYQINRQSGDIALDKLYEIGAENVCSQSGCRDNAFN